jgi:hypothetical protein
MKRLVIAISILMLISTASNAQFIRFGVKGGVSSSTVKFNDTQWSDVATLDGVKDLMVEQGDAKLGLHFGLFGRIQAFGVFIQPEFLFTQTQGEFVITEEGTAYQKVAKQKFNKIDIPVLVGWKIGPARLGVGPVASIMLSENSDFKKLTAESAENEMKTATFGYQVGAGLDILKFATLDVRYEGNFSKLGDGVKIGSKSYSFDQRNPQWIFSLGIFF